ncbi:MAG: hypothetical protein GX466_05775 [Candidatus Cloacimonetes bacterium]|jgi:hypothetical protein|nr:hypothetical protein [Candidatus Cloacimonadota bacterium]
MRNYSRDRSRFGKNGSKPKKPKNPQYDFVPVKQDPARQLVDLVYFNENKRNDLFTGEIKCSLYVLNHLLVGNEHTDIDTDGCGTINPLLLDEETLLVSPYSLKGCISNFIAQLLQIPMTRINKLDFKQPKYKMRIRRDKPITSAIKGYYPFLSGELTHANKKKLGILRSMFGYSLDRNEEKLLEKMCNKGGYWQDHSAKAAKVHFNYAVHIPETGTIGGYDLKLAGEPKDTPEYFDQLTNDNIVMKGRKVYRRYYACPKTTADKSNVLEQVASYDPGKLYPVFRFKCHCENLLPDELRYLLFALHQGENDFDATIPKDKLPDKIRSHQIGYGKNFGWGVIKITVDDINPLPPKIDFSVCENLLKANVKLADNIKYDPLGKEYECRARKP